MGNGLNLPKIEIPVVKVEVPKSIDPFDSMTGIRSNHYFEGRFIATEKGIDGTDDVMVIGPKFDDPKMKITPDLKQNAGVKYMELGVAGEGLASHDSGAVSVSPVVQAMFHSVTAPIPILPLVVGLEQMAEEVMELDENDLIYEQDPLFFSLSSPAQGLNHLFDLSDVEPFQNNASEGSFPFSTVTTSGFRPEEEAWFLNGEASGGTALPFFEDPRLEMFPQARALPQRSNKFFSLLGSVARTIWSAWKSETGRYPFLFMGFQFLLGGPGSTVVQGSDGNRYEVLSHDPAQAALGGTLAYVKNPSDVVVLPNGSVEVALTRFFGAGKISFVFNPQEANALGLAAGVARKKIFILRPVSTP
jgi:hypothetical protein